jgi:MYXO-CTERM domain-containing protein
MSIPRAFSSILPTGVLLAVFMGAPLAYADVLPADDCQTGSAGSSCSNAGPEANQPGVCTEATCTHVSPMGDGGSSSSSYACLLCQEADGGTITPKTGANQEPGSSSSGGCSASSGSTPGGGLGLVLAAGLFGLGLTRRRRSA